MIDDDYHYENLILPYYQFLKYGNNFTSMFINNHHIICIGWLYYWSITWIGHWTEITFKFNWRCWSFLTTLLSFFFFVSFIISFLNFALFFLNGWLFTRCWFSLIFRHFTGWCDLNLALNCGLRWFSLKFYWFLFNAFFLYLFLVCTEKKNCQSLNLENLEI